MSTSESPGLIRHLREAGHVVVFTGAGVSQESGVPTFRDTLTGLWSNFDAEELATLRAFSKDPDLVWGWYEWRRALVLRCEPNPAHYAIAAMEKVVPKLTLITQNVDDLHERAGSTSPIHLHGSLHHPRCRACGRPHAPFIPIQSDPDGGRLAPPRCSHCGGRVQPGVVWFGENLPADAWRQARQAAGACDVLISVGTSALVYPAAELPLLAAQKEACVIQVNPCPTELDKIARYNLREKAGQVLPELIENAFAV